MMSSRAQRTVRLAGGVGAVVLFFVALMAAQMATAPDRVNPRPRADSDLVAPMSAAERDVLLSEYGIVVETPPTTAVDVSEDQAVTAALRAAPALTGDGPPASRGLTMFSDRAWGPENSEGEVVPRYEDRLAWVIRFPDRDIPILGQRLVPEGEEPSVDAPKTYVADVLVFVDGTTGQVIESVTV